MDNKQMQIKVCGITTVTQAVELVQSNVDYIGFIFYPKSKRNVTKPILFDKKNKNIVAVFVNPTINEIENAQQYLPNITHIQLHGKESPEFCNNLYNNFTIIKAFSIDDTVTNIDALVAPYLDNTHQFLFDTKTPLYGGSGVQFDWQILKTYTGDIPFLLSGGIGINDIETVKHFKHKRFIGVDINSKMEIKPGEKNLELVTNFVNKIKFKNDSTT